jgi:hypothetical protein
MRGRSSCVRSSIGSGAAGTSRSTPRSSEPSRARASTAASNFSPAAKISYNATPTVAIGLEYYGSLGRVTHFDRPRDQQHQLFPVIDLDLGPRWEFNAGIGFGLTPSTDRLIVKMILGYRFNWAGGAGR